MTFTTKFDVGQTVWVVRFSNIPATQCKCCEQFIANPLWLIAAREVISFISASTPPSSTVYLSGSHPGGNRAEEGDIFLTQEEATVEATKRMEKARKEYKGK